MVLGGDSTRVVRPLFQAEGDGSIPISPLQLIIEHIDPVIAVNLNGLWHSRLPKLKLIEVCNPCFSAEYANRYYAVAIWSIPIAANRIKDGFNYLELRRMAISSDAPRNTASRMLAVMTKIIRRERLKVKRLLSYQDTEVHTGTIYKAAGWVKANEQKEISLWELRGNGRMDQTISLKIRWELDLYPNLR